MRVSELSKSLVDSLDPLKNGDVKIQWSSDYYDGPLEGIAEYKGETAWFILAIENESEKDGSWFRKLWLIKLSDKQASHARNMHSDFKLFVGEQFDHKPDGLRKGGYPKPKEMWSKFYSKYDDNSFSLNTLSSNEVIGWFYWPPQMPA